MVMSAIFHRMLAQYGYDGIELLVKQKKNKQKMVTTHIETMLSIWQEILTFFFFILSFRSAPMDIFYSFFKTIKPQKGNKWQTKKKWKLYRRIFGVNESYPLFYSTFCTLRWFFSLLLLFCSVLFCVCMLRIWNNSTLSAKQMTSFKRNF